MPSAEDALAPVAGRLIALAEADPAREVCGLVVAGGGPPEPWPLPNRSASPARAFLIAPADLLTALRRLDAEGLELLAVYHSHPHGGGDLSPRDLAEALVDGLPLLAGVAQVVVALEQGRGALVRAHRWGQGRFEPVDLWTPVHGVGGTAP